MIKLLWTILIALPVFLWWALSTTGNAILGARDAVRNFGLWLNKPAQTHGQAQFADWKLLKKTAHAKPDGWYIGLQEGKKVYTDSEACVIGIAPRRTGKSNAAKAMLRAQAARGRKPDVIVFDPHGDLRPAIIETYQAMGYETQFLNFTDPMNSDQHNPISYVSGNPMFQALDCNQIVKLIMEQKKGDHEHFTNFPRLVIAGIIAYKQRTDPANATMASIVKLMVASQADRAKLFDDMAKNGGPIEVAGVTAFRDAGEKERGSFGTTMAWKLQAWMWENFIQVTSGSGFTWEGNYLNPEPVLTVITTGGSDLQGAAARLIIGNAINTRVKMWPTVVATHRGSGRPRFPKELKILLDEPRLLGNCEAVVTAVTETGKMDVSLCMWMLGMRDLYDIYPSASVIANSSNLIVFGGGTEMSTYEDVSRMVGDKTIANKAFSHSDNGSSQSWSEQALRVIKPDQLRMLPADELVVVASQLSMRLKKTTRIVDRRGEKVLVYL